MTTNKLQFELKSYNLRWIPGYCWVTPPLYNVKSPRIPRCLTNWTGSAINSTFTLLPKQKNWKYFSPGWLIHVEVNVSTSCRTACWKSRRSERPMWVITRARSGHQVGTTPGRPSWALSNFLSHLPMLRLKGCFQLVKANLLLTFWKL